MQDDVETDPRLAAEEDQDAARRAAQDRLRVLWAQPLVTIAEAEEAAELRASLRLEDAARARGQSSAAAALAWERLRRIGYRRRSLFKALAAER